MPVTAIPAWKSSPFLRIIIPFIAAIVLDAYVTILPIAWWITACCSLVLIIGFQLLPASVVFRWRWVNGLLVNSFIIAFASLVMNYSNPFNHPSHFLQHYQPGNELIVSIADAPEERGNYLRVKGEVKQISGYRNQMVKGKILLYFYRDSLVPEPGDVYAISKIPGEITASGNPDAFNFKEYSRLQGISHQLFLRTSDYRRLAQRQLNWYERFLHSVRQYVLRTLRSNIPGKKEVGLAEAMLIGYRADLDSELLQAYSNTGVVHLIAISGLHLGLIYAILAKFCSLVRIRHRVLRPLIIFLALWTFAFIAGASPSVLRSAVMFTFILIGGTLKRKVPVVNSLAASAFVLLCVNPLWLWDIGFQLSYAAVLSIVLLMKPIYNLLVFTNPLLDNLWQLNSITIAAQVLTMPVALYYFKQFPNYFLVSNLVAVPLSSLILIIELALFPLAIYEPLARATGIVLHYLIKWLNEFIGYCNKLPFATWDSISINMVQVISLYVMLFFAIVAFLNRSGRKLFPCLFALLVFAVARFISFVNAAEQQKVIVYNIARHQCIDIVSGRSIFFLADTALENNQKALKFSVVPNRTEMRALFVEPYYKVKPADFLVSSETAAVLVLSGRKERKLKISDEKTCVILSNNASVNVLNIATTLPITKMVIDRSNSPNQAKRWKLDCAALGIPFIDIAEKGAFVMNLN